MSNLLEVTRWKTGALSKAEVTPVCMEFQVTPECAPFLVSTRKSLLWVDKVLPDNLIRAAVRDISAPGDLFFEVVQEIARMGVECEWGNVQPYTPEGLVGAVTHLKSYDLLDCELLLAPGKKRPEWLKPSALEGLVTRSCSWLQPGWAVLVPRDRQFVGALVHLRPKQVVIAIHNASRGVAILRRDQETTDAPLHMAE